MMLKTLIKKIFEFGDKILRNDLKNIKIQVLICHLLYKVFNKIIDKIIFNINYSLS